MKKPTVIILIIAAVMTVFGSVIVLCGLAALNFDLPRLGGGAYKPYSHVINEDITDIYIEGAECDIVITETDGESKLDYVASDGIKYDITVEDGKLTVKRVDTRHWYEHIGFYWENSYIRLYLSTAVDHRYNSMTLKTLSGDITVKRGMAVENADIESASGDIKYSGSAFGSLKLTSASGEIEINGDAENTVHFPDTYVTVATASGEVVIDHVDGGNISVNCASADVELRSVRCDNLDIITASGEQELVNVISKGKLNLSSASGDIDLDFCDGEDIGMKTQSGDISAVLCSEKIFSIHTSSGRIDCPDSKNGGGYCRVETSSGDIKIKLAH